MLEWTEILILEDDFQIAEKNKNSNGNKPSKKVRIMALAKFI